MFVVYAEDRDLLPDNGSLTNPIRSRTTWPHWQSALFAFPFVKIKGRAVAAKAEVMRIPSHVGRQPRIAKISAAHPTPIPNAAGLKVGNP